MWIGRFNRPRKPEKKGVSRTQETVFTKIVTYISVEGEPFVRPIYLVSRLCPQARQKLTFQTAISFQTQQTAWYSTPDSSSGPQNHRPVPRHRPHQPPLQARPHFRMANPPLCSRILCYYHSAAPHTSAGGPRGPSPEAFSSVSAAAAEAQRGTRRAP